MTSSTTEQRIAKVAEWILAGMRGSQVVEHCAKEGWQVTQDEAADLIGDAHLLISKDVEIDPKRESDKAIARLNMLYTRAIAIQDYKTALSIQRELNAVVARRTNPLTSPE